MSGYQLLGPILTLVAASDMSAYYGRCMFVDTNGKYAKTGAGGVVNAISTDKVIAGQGMSGQFRDVAEVECGGVVPIGPVKADANGRAVAATAAEALSGVAFGIALEAGVNLGTAPVMLNNTGLASVGGGYLDTALAPGALAAANLYSIIFFSIDGTKTAALPNGIYPGQKLSLACDAGTNTPAGTITGAFLSQAEATGTTLSYNAAADQADLVWTGAAWRTITLTSVTLT